MTIPFEKVNPYKIALSAVQDTDIIIVSKDDKVVDIAKFDSSENKWNSSFAEYDTLNEIYDYLIATYGENMVLEKETDTQNLVVEKDYLEPVFEAKKYIVCENSEAILVEDKVDLNSMSDKTFVEIVTELIEQNCNIYKFTN